MTLNKKNKMVFIGNMRSSFVKNDYNILKNHFDICYVKPPSKKIGWLKYIFILSKEIRKCDLTFSWFASCESAFVVFFSKLFKKKSIIIVGGYDAVFAPEINYGAYTDKIEKRFVNYVYKNVDKILVVNNHLKDKIIKNAKIKGYNIDYLPTGHDGEYWKSKGKKENIVLTVAGIHDIKRVKVKGLNTFIKSAKHLQDIRFIIIGAKDEAKDYLKSIVPENVELIDYLPRDDLLKYYQMSKVYCQLSYSEGLPTSLCESMLCECVPVGSKANGIKSVIGNTGFYADYGDEKSTSEMIQKALKSKDILGKKARERVINLFSADQRKRGLEQFVFGMIQ